MATRRRSEPRSSLAPRQSRSERTRRRILDAAGAFLARAGTGELPPVNEIARRAGVSVGGFYARFPGKDGLLHAFDEEIHARVRATLRETMDDAKLAAKDVHGVVETYLSMVADFFDSNREVLRQVAKESRTGGDPAFVERVRAFNAEAHGRLHALLLARRAAIAHEDPESAIDLATLFTSAALRECLLFGERKLNRSRLEKRRLVDELTRAYCAYLGAPARGASPPRKPGRKTGPAS